MSKVKSTSQRNDTRQELIRVGTEIIAQRGFNTTGIEAVLKTAKVPKGSFYYYFASKDDFGLAVIDQFAAEYMHELDEFLKDKSASPLTRIRNYLEAGVAAMTGCACSRGCPIGNLSQEMANQSEKFRARLEQVFLSWKRRLAECLEEARQAGEISPESDVEQLAEFLLTGWEGASLRAKVTRSVKPMEDFIEIFFTRVLR